MLELRLGNVRHDQRQQAREYRGQASVVRWHRARYHKRAGLVPNVTCPAVACTNTMRESQKSGELTVALLTVTTLTGMITTGMTTSRALPCLFGRVLVFLVFLVF